MKIIKILLLIFILNCFSSTINAQFIQVDDTYTAQRLVQNVLINSPCATVSNFSVKGDLISGPEKSYGYFNAGTSSFPFVNGIVLATSRVNKTPGPNDNLIDEGSTSWLGDADLETAVNFTGTYNATALEFDFVPLTTKISFDYLFASEEYQGNAPCRYSDAFAFLLKPVGATTPYQNLALIPGTNSPVLVTSVHPLIAGNNGCPAINETYFDTYNGVNAPINLNGQTKVMTASADVIPGTTYHIKLVIADHENVRYDSAIFLAGGSFKIGTNLGADKLISNKNPICEGEKFLLNATISGGTYKWFRNNIQIFDSISGLPITTSTYEVTNSGTYKVEVYINPTCTSTDEILIEFIAKPILNNATLVQCDDDLDGKSFFDLTKLNNFIKNNIANVPLLNASNVVEYFIDSNATIAIANQTNYQNNDTNPLIIYAKVKNEFGCSAIATINLSISNNSIPDQIINFCDDDAIQDGKTSINLDTELTSKLNSLSLFPVGLVVSYFNTISDAVLQKNQVSNLFTNSIVNQQVLYGRVLNGSDCYGIIKITLNILSFSGDAFKDETKYICPNKNLKLEVPTGFSYIWSNGNTTDNFINIISKGVFTVKITNGDCFIVKTFNVLDADLASINSIEVNDFNQNGNTILVNYSGNANYEFSIDGINFQNNPLFTNVPIGEYFITVRDKNNCDDVISDLIYVLDFPKYFTPNSDGINDTWKIDNLNKTVLITIYNRLGKLLYQFDSNSDGWNGTFNQELLPADDYWFTINLDNNRIIKNHFALKR